MFATTFTASQIRQAEAVLLDDESVPDQLMQSAAHAVFQVADAWLRGDTGDAGDAGDAGEAEDRVLVLAGGGGNGGDALYAGAELALAGHGVDAVLVADEAHERALTAFRNAGGTVLEELPEYLWSHRLIIDGIVGIGGGAGLRAELAEVVEFCRSRARLDTQILAVDVPSGVDADTGEAGDLYIPADVTVTFGGWRRAHALSPDCGLQLLADVGLPGRPLHTLLIDTLPEWAADGPPLVVSARAVVPDLALPEGITTMPPGWRLDVEPGAADDKYSGGVAGIFAGSGTYPGAAILCTAGAVNATPAMVRYAGPQALEVVRAHPEVVVTESLADAGRVQAWVFGPGADPGLDTADQLRWVLERQEPVLIDATGLTLLATHEDLRELVVKREAHTVLTPHDGEFTRLREAVGLPEGSRWEETRALASELQCAIVRKGRITLVATEELLEPVAAVDAGHSWAATPGSGDVLAGVVGAHLASDPESHALQFLLAQAVAVHASAAKLAAATPFGDATAPASRIASFVREATARSGAI
ncbi:bifunctional ADP-dependent NAD(P)H-hydrate dehydratase/NAD(P)H-hydrate epimerase [Corynebacterium glaucum]|uniref:bifunctional ADP-dependent NAD(P)H-hydrate dehydratase/NAD(P)H-hydrate epimerase n=1 Tax=Corynebacterium glaucum TaxID=187491 RepID=UPI00265A9FAF|nr:bifunctional ADP-dependent NAD(P)H-hydrate dehydratase/NAD(P)H-hydrate epimerase [Corynebacterium glaucum]